MKSKIVIFLIIASFGLSSSCFADYQEGNLDYLGYSEELSDLVDEEIGLIYQEEVEDSEENDECDDEDTENNIIIKRNKAIKEEADATVEQLKELGVSRSIKKEMKDQSAIVKEKNRKYWEIINARTSQQEKKEKVSEETKQLIKNNIAKALKSNGYKVVQLDILPLPEYSTKNAVRAVVRVVKPMETGSYNEVQTRLSNIKEICTKAATINNKCMLSEMTTFIAENPKNNYYYEKTILR